MKKCLKKIVCFCLCLAICMTATGCTAGKKKKNIIEEEYSNYSEQKESPEESIWRIGR